MRKIVSVILITLGLCSVVAPAAIANGGPPNPPKCSGC